MCNLYSIRRPRDAVIGLFGISHAEDGAQLELPAVYPDAASSNQIHGVIASPAVALRNNDCERRVTKMRHSTFLGCQS